MSHYINKLMIGLFSLMLFSAMTLFGASKYEERVVIPKYNPNDPTHVLITPSNGKWNRYVLNDPNKKHFYVKPGKYHTRINLTRSGTKNSRRTMSLYNGNNKHPASLPANQVADVRLYFKGASYWVFDRLVSLNDTSLNNFGFSNRASHNILNRFHLKNYFQGLRIKPFCSFNTIQNSYFDHMTHAGRMDDNVAIALLHNNIRGAVTEGTKIIKNDIRNANDGIQLVVAGNLTPLDISFPNTVIDSNNIWMDGDVYTNGKYTTSGYNKSGQYMIGENAIDLKGGSLNASKPVRITNNRLWGYQRGDKSINGYLTSGPGTPMVIHRKDNQNIRIEQNIIFDSERTIGMIDVEDCQIVNNIFTQINKINPENEHTYGLFVYRSKNVKIEKNTFANIYANAQGGGYFFNYNKTINSPFIHNVVISSPGTRSNYGNTVNDNYFYNTRNVHFNGTNDHIFSTQSAAKMTDYTFIYERFTAHPKHKTLKGVITTKNSPHYGKAGAVLQAPTPPNNNTVVYEDAQDGNTKGWDVSDNTPAGATISNFYDAEKRSFVIEVDGDGLHNAYRLAFWKSKYGSNTTNRYIQWKLNYNEPFRVFIGVDTQQGKRYLYYTAENRDNGINKQNSIFIHFGLGRKAMNGTWQTFTRDIRADLRKFEPNNDVISVSAFIIRGSGKIDDITMFGKKITTPTIITYEDAQDGKIDGWDVYDNTPAGARIRNVYDAQKRSRVIELSGKGMENGYRLGYWKNGTEFKNTKDKKLRWRMKYSENFRVYIGVQTTKGFRYLTYTNSNTSAGFNSTKTSIHHGLGRRASNGTWQTFTRDLQADLQEFDKGNNITSVNTFLIRGSGKIDDIQMSSRF